jgi:hypothetical protein
MPHPNSDDEPITTTSLKKAYEEMNRAYYDNSEPPSFNAFREEIRDLGYFEIAYSLRVKRKP